MRRIAIDEERLLFLRAMLATGDWVSGRFIQSSIHRTFGDPIYKPEMDYLRREVGIEFEDRMIGTSHHFYYRLAQRGYVQGGLFG